MVSREEILNSLQYVVDNSKFVSISQNAILKYVQNFVLTPATHWSHQTPFKYPGQKTFEEEIDFLFLIGNQAFCYWGSPKWTIDYQNQKLDGWWAAIASFQRAIESGTSILDGSYLASLSEEQTKELFAGTPEIPLLIERQGMLNKIGRVLEAKYAGSFHNFFSSVDKTAINLAQALSDEFAGFDDTASYKGKRVYFYKKAQLVVNDIFSNILGQDSNITGIGQLLGTADYKIPAILRQHWILEYTTDLAERIDNQVEILEKSEEEVEIRASQLIAVKQISDLLKPKYPQLTPPAIQDILWLSTQGLGSLQKPYHLTKTIYY